MRLRERLHPLTTVEEVDRFLDLYPVCALFKAGGCHKTMQGFGYVEQAMDPRKHLQMGLVKVIEHRPASNHIAQVTGVVHQSPQFILIKDRRAVYDVDNWNIVPEAIEGALLAHFGPVEKTNAEEMASCVAPYLTLLKQYLSQELDERSFTQQWLLTFQQDSTLRSTREFTLLNSLFGDVDLALSEHPLQGLKPPCKGHNPLKMRAEALFQKLNHISSTR